MTLSDLRTELKSRLNGPGYKHLTDTRATRLINRAYHRICEGDDWVWLRTSTTGSAPITVSDLRTVLSVVDTTTQAVLTHLDERQIIDNVDPILTDTGTPEYYYRTSDTVLSVYPANTSDTLKVTYIKVPTDLSADGDTPVVPTRYHLAIIDAAQCDALKDYGKYDEARACEANFQSLLNEMRLTYLFDHHDGEFQQAVPQDY